MDWHLTLSLILDTSIIGSWDVETSALRFKTERLNVETQALRSI